MRANVDLIEGLAYFEDRGLDQLTYYWYRITAVDEHFMESDFSDVTEQTTMPAELENFPLPFAVQTSGHPAVGDIDGDGKLEIVLASDEVYAWNDDGSELVDGDNNAQTTGPLTNVHGQFGPAGVALADLDGEPGLEIIVSERIGQPRIIVYKADGSILPGWPRNMQSSWNWSTPSVGDVDGDGGMEVVVNDLGGRLFVWHADGTELVDGDNNPATNGVFIDRPDSWTLSSPALYDLDGDGACEMIFGTRVYTGDNALLAYRYDGTQAAGFPVSTGYDNILCSPAVADLDRDGEREVIFFTTANKLYAVRANGAAYPGFPVSYPLVYDDSAGPSPAVGNFDGDPAFEILWPVNAGSFRMDLLAIDTDVAGGTSGHIMPGWPVQLPANSEGSPVVGDLDGDGLSDVVQPIGSDETETPDLIMAFNHRGEGLPGFPIALGGHCRSTPVICDLDGDGDTDLVYGSWDLELHVWDLPAGYDPTTIPWPTFQGTAQRNGLAVQTSVTAVPEDLPSAFTVLPPRPNPFNPVTTVRLYVVPGADTRLDLSVYDVRGREVRRLHHGDAGSGWHEFTWDGRDDSGRGQSSGVYFVRARQAASTQTFKMTLVK
ncbi:MAG: FG-GAP-like repeat-containing protein [Candidatus Krumholzibacteriia bacterium]